VRAKSRNSNFVEHDISSFFRCVSLHVQDTRLKFAIKLECKVMHLFLPIGFAHCLLRECRIAKYKFCRAGQIVVFPLRLSTFASYKAEICCHVGVQSDASNSNKRSCTLFSPCVQNREMQVLSSMTFRRFSVVSLYLCKLQGLNFLSC
jgi:hypothetical protein